MTTIFLTAPQIKAEYFSESLNIITLIATHSAGLSENGCYQICLISTTIHAFPTLTWAEGETSEQKGYARLIQGKRGQNG